VGCTVDIKTNTPGRKVKVVSGGNILEKCEESVVYSSVSFG